MNLNNTAPGLDNGQWKREIGNVISQVQSAKVAAYRMAWRYVQLADEHRLAAMVDGQRFEDWIDEQFMGLTALGGDPHELIWAVHEGLTLGDYLDRPGVFIPCWFHRLVKEREAAEREARRRRSKAPAKRRAAGQRNVKERVPQ